MFKFLKEKLKKAISSIGKKVEEETLKEVDEIREEPKKEGFFSRFKKKEEKLETEVEEKRIKEKAEIKTIVEEPKEKAEKEKTKKEKIVDEEIKQEKEEVEEKKGFFGKLKEKIITKKISEEKFEELFFDLEIALLENNVALEVVEKIREDLKKELVDKPIPRSNIEKIIKESLKTSIGEVLSIEGIDLMKEIKISEKPYVILILGYNGSGKTLSCARLAYYLNKKGFKSILAAADTFRAAGATQLEELAKKAKIPVITGQTGSDSAALIFDTIKSAKAKNYDVVIADTAGRIHSNKDLLNELKKIVRVNKPHLKLLVIDALSGTDVIEQARQFDEAIGINGFIITKVDSYEKGGSVLNASYITKKPILFFGLGQKIDSFKEYSPQEVLTNLGFN